MKLASAFGDTDGALKAFADAQATATSAAMQAVSRGLTQDLRAQVTGAGLGQKLANTWRGKVYPAGKPSADASAFVFSKAPTIIYAYDQGAVISPTDGRRYLAIPTKNVPMKARGKRMTPLDVETAFNQDLTILPRGDGKLLAFVKVVASVSKKGFRRATQARLAQGRGVKLVLMFTLVRQVRVARKLNIDAAASKWADLVPELIDQNWRA